MTHASKPVDAPDPLAPRAFAERLLELGRAVRDRLIAARGGGLDLATAVGHEGGDTIFAIDREVEPVIDAALRSWPQACRPLELIAEGMGADGVTMYPGPDQPDAPAAPGERPAPRFVVIVDPIDGTRNIMYDKRSAYFIAAVCPVTPGARPTLRDVIASVMVELPPSKQTLADELAATVDEGLITRRVDLRTGDASDLPLRASTAPTLLHGFGQVSNFFPGTKVLAASLMEAIAQATLGEVRPGEAAIFDDQFICTAGQMVELAAGHDRFCCDLRPLFYQAIARQTGSDVRGLECHPYDLAGMLVAQQAGIVLTDGFGRPLDAPLDVHAGVHWCGYANAKLRDAIQPVIQQWLADQGVTPPDAD